MRPGVPLRPAVLAVVGLTFPSFAADVLLREGAATAYQILLPDTFPSPSLQACAEQQARLVQAAFEAAGARIAVSPESLRDPDKPGIYLGATRFANSHGVNLSGVEDWTYELRVAGNNVIIAGCDRPARVPSPGRGREPWDLYGTAKGVVDFARTFLGVRFLYPELPGYQNVGKAAKLDFLKTPALEFLPAERFSVPADLQVRKTPRLRVNTAHPEGGGFYDIALNRFPRVDERFGGHTWERAVPASEFAEHPEYFALVNGVRQAPEAGHAQFCLSNKDFQERVYAEMVRSAEAGYGAVDLGQPDGFRECQCTACRDLYGSGPNWTEKIWAFHRDTAARLNRSHPKVEVTMMSYILTARPPAAFREFPPNTSVMLTGTNVEDIAPWLGHVVPKGFSGYVYNWCPNLGTRYTPMRTPGYVEEQVRRLAAHGIRALYRDGPGQLFGLEGPVYYVMGRMFDDPEGLSAGPLMEEFCEAAFGRAASAMRPFYARLYQAVAPYSDHLGTRNDAWVYKAYEGRPRKTISDPFQLFCFLYPPGVLAELESALASAERLAEHARARARLALVRTEFEYLKDLSRVAHLYQAFLLVPDAGSRARLLDAIDARNARIAGLFEKSVLAAQAAVWGHVLFPFPGHNEAHLRLAHDGYQEPFADSCFNWNTALLRALPEPSKGILKAARVEGAPGWNDPAWTRTQEQALVPQPPFLRRVTPAGLRVLHDGSMLHFRFAAGLDKEDGPAAKKFVRDGDLSGEEAVDVVLQGSDGNLLYRFTQGMDPGATRDALTGLVTDLMDPRFGREDPKWNGQWSALTRRTDTGWEALLSIPLQTLGVVYAPGMTLRANAARVHPAKRNTADRYLWSSGLGRTQLTDPALLGEIILE